MNFSDRCSGFVLTKCKKYVFERIPDVNDRTSVCFQLEKVKCELGFQSDILAGRLECSDEKGNIESSKELLLKIFPDLSIRQSFVEVTFQNEIFVYNKIIPFYAQMRDSIVTLFPKFYGAQLNLGNGKEAEEGMIIMENLTKSGYRATESKIFLSIDHLLVMMKKLGEFHAYSYRAKKEYPEMFYSLVDCLKESQRPAVKIFVGNLNADNEYIFDVISHDSKYAEKVQQIRKLVGKADEFITKIYDSKIEPMAVICHGDFLRNNALFMYDVDNHPIDAKIIDLGNVKYSTPVIDLGLVLYMNSDQTTRDEYWDLLIDMYYDSLKNTFPDNDLVPSKEDILAEFKVNVLNCYLLIASFLPRMMVVEDEVDNPNWLQDLYEPEYVEYKCMPLSDIPEDVKVKVLLKLLIPRRVEKVFDIFRDIIDRGFV